MHGYVIRKRNRYYAVIYEGLDPVTGRVGHWTGFHLSAPVRLWV